MPKVGMEPIRRAETINAALECICEYGIDNMTLDMVAAKAGFSKGIVAYYFKTKKKLISECLKAFMSTYKVKISSSIKPEMEPLQMIRTVVEAYLPPLDSSQGDRTINVSLLSEKDRIHLPHDKMAKLFIQFISKAANDEELKLMMKNIFADDVEGISILVQFAKKVYSASQLDEKETAYALLSMIYGLSFFRITDYMPADKKDNRELAFDFIDRIFQPYLPADKK
ncbi:TetR family transcriptional regulator [Sinanaerobacter chloroacetimidivorans]|uniref:TetR family transcriptional regulator n=1 Tax=Sinanaerobacter chloroacetimidivorans TaxID=2818044 RepID=A0A8J7W3U0_9FIRM|nr:TetR family transcriptional regulator [Sinanaerobacter chloroacetimidivorans]MBR0600387.1 TetR family transcriptional regulator [Sinanaerobacter chloroacetimidivorans]